MFLFRILEGILLFEILLLVILAYLNYQYLKSKFIKDFQFKRDGEKFPLSQAGAMYPILLACMVFGRLLTNVFGLTEVKQGVYVSNSVEIAAIALIFEDLSTLIALYFGFSFCFAIIKAVIILRMQEAEIYAQKIYYGMNSLLFFFLVLSVILQASTNLQIYYACFLIPMQIWLFFVVVSLIYASYYIIPLLSLNEEDSKSNKSKSLWSRPIELPVNRQVNNETLKIENKATSIELPSNTEVTVEVKIPELNEIVNSIELPEHNPKVEVASVVTSNHSRNASIVDHVRTAPSWAVYSDREAADEKIPSVTTNHSGKSKTVESSNNLTVSIVNRTAIFRIYLYIAIASSLAAIGYGFYLDMAYDYFLYFCFNRRYMTDKSVSFAPKSSDNPFGQYIVWFSVVCLSITGLRFSKIRFGA